MRKTCIKNRLTFSNNTKLLSILKVKTTIHIIMKRLMWFNHIFNFHLKGNMMSDKKFGMSKGLITS